MRTFFGYGSLLNCSSRSDTLSACENIRPAYIVGYRREFSVWNERGPATGPFKGIPMHCLNVVADTTGRVNGIVFDISDDRVPLLQTREAGYQIEITDAFLYEPATRLPVEVFSKHVHTLQTYNFDLPVQRYYLDLCLTGAHSFGDAFYEDFIQTTYIHGVPVKTYLP